MRHVHEFNVRDGALAVERHLTWFVTTKQQALKELAERGQIR